MSKPQESTADMVARISVTEVHQRLLKAKENFLPIIGTGSGAYKDKNGELVVIATKGDIKKCTEQALRDEGLIGYFSQAPSRHTERTICFQYQIVHADSGQKLTFYHDMPIEKGTCWDYGSAQTYAYRFLIGDLLGLTVVDSVEQLEQDGESLQLHQMYTAFYNDVTKSNDVKAYSKAKKDHKKFLEYIKEYNKRDYINIVARDIRVTEARLQIGGDDVPA